MRRTFAVILVAACCKTTPPPVAPAPAPPTPEPPPVPVQPTRSTSADGPPVAKVEVVTDSFHGVDVKDPYRWLEKDEDADVKTWSAGQNKFARDILDKLPEIDTIREELRAIFDAPITNYGSLHPAGGKLFASRKQPKHEQPELIVMDDPSAADRAKLIFDPAAAGGAQQAVDWWVPAPDGKKIAVSISLNGSEAGTLHVLDLDGKDLEPPIPNVQRGTGGGSVAWTPDSRGLYYTRYPSQGEKPDDELSFWMQVWFHQLGTTLDKDRYEMGKDLPKIGEIQLASDKHGRVIATVQNGDGGTFRHYLRDGKAWRQLDDWSDRIVEITFGEHDELWLVSRAGAERGKVMRMPITAKTAAEAKDILPEGADAIVTAFEGDGGVVATKDRIYVKYQTGGPSEIRAFTTTGKPAKAPELPPLSAVSFPIPWKTGVIVGSMSFTTPWAWRSFDERTGKLVEITPLSQKPPVDLSDFEVSREFAISKDGAKVPLNIVWPKGAPKDGSMPCATTGYGGYGVNIEPSFLGGFAPLLKRNVCVVVANLRGGGEFGDAWHAAGALLRKQNVFDDFAAVLRFLADRKYTSPRHLAIVGGSNGGLLMGATLTQHPELANTVVSEVGIYDMLRVELSPNGAYNTTEFGSVKDPEQFKALYAYSPYHHVVAGMKYPTILMTTGANDPRVSPWQSRKMVAALQAAGATILLRTTDKAGHGMGSSTSERIDLGAHRIAFLLAHVK
jgi:prolyl oligopeptidase